MVILLDDFTKIYMQRRPNGMPFLEVQCFATMLVKAFPEVKATPVSADSTHSRAGVDVQRAQQFLESIGPLLKDNIAAKVPGTHHPLSPAARALATRCCHRR